jgi:hypothetical protein
MANGDVNPGLRARGDYPGAIRGVECDENWPNHCPRVKEKIMTTIHCRPRRPARGLDKRAVAPKAKKLHFRLDQIWRGAQMLENLTLEVVH